MNTLKFAKMLEASGISRKHAEKHVQVLNEAMETTMVTKSDLADTEKKLSSEIQEVRSELSKRIEQVYIELKLEIRETVFKLGAFITFLLIAAPAVFKLMNYFFP